MGSFTQDKIRRVQHLLIYLDMKLSALSLVILLVCYDSASSNNASNDNFLTCTICEGVVTALDEALVDPASEQAVADYLLQVCSYVGDNLESICDEFIAEYTDDIIDQLVDKFLNPDEVCKAINACP